MCHPCGYVMDYLRKGYTVKMKTSLDLPPADILWYRTCPNAPIFTKPTKFRSGFYTQDWQNTGLGEVRSSQYLPCHDDYAMYHGPNPIPLDSDHYCGTDTVWENGGTVGIDPVITTDADGVCPDCGRATLEGFGGEMEGHALPGEGYSVSASIPSSIPESHPGSHPESSPSIPTVLSPCCADPVPSRLYCTITNALNCPCASGVIPLDYNSASEKWEGTGDLGSCGHMVTVKLYCVSGHWYMDQIPDACPASGGNMISAYTQQCKPFYADFINVIWGTDCGCLFSGSITFTVTDTM